MELAEWLKASSYSPFVRTARHSSSVLWSGNDILEEEEVDEEPKRLPRKGMVGMDLSWCWRRRLCACWAWAEAVRTRLRLERVKRVRRKLENGGIRMRGDGPGPSLVGYIYTVMAV